MFVQEVGFIIVVNFLDYLVGIMIDKDLRYKVVIGKMKLNVFIFDIMLSLVIIMFLFVIVVDV